MGSSYKLPGSIPTRRSAELKDWTSLWSSQWLSGQKFLKMQWLTLGERGYSFDNIGPSWSWDSQIDYIQIYTSAPESEHYKNNLQQLPKAQRLKIGSRLSWRHVQLQLGYLQAMLQTKQQDHLHICTIKASSKHNQRITKNNRLPTV